MKKLITILFIFLAFSRSNAQTANAGTDQTVILPTTSVTVGGASSASSYLWTKIYDVTMPTNTSTWVRSTPPTDPATITSPTSATTTITGMIQGTWYYRIAATTGGTTVYDTVIVNVDVFATPSNSTNFINYNFKDATFKGDVNLRTMDTTQHYGAGSTYHNSINLGSTAGTGYMLRDRQQLQMIDTSGGKMYYGIRDGVGGYVASGGMTSTTAANYNEGIGTVYIYDWKGYLDQSFATLAGGSGSNGDKFFFENHASQAIVNLSPSLSIAYKTGDSLAIYESVGLSGDANINGVGSTYWASVFRGDHFSNAFAHVDAFNNQAHSLRMTIKEGDNGTGAFFKVEYDGNLIYLRTDGNVGQTYNTSPKDYPVFGEIYDNQQFFCATANTTRHRQANAVVEKTQGYYMTGNNAPTANAGSSQTLSTGTTSTTLTGSGADVGGYVASYAWTKTAGASCTISSASSASTGITGLTTGSYTFLLTTTDNQGATGTSSMTVTVGSPSINYIIRHGNHIYK